MAVAWPSRTPSGSKLPIPKRRLNAQDIAAVTAALARFGRPDRGELHEVLSLGAVHRLARGEALLRAGEAATQLGIVLTGLLREYFVTPGGRQRTKAFAQRGQLTGSLPDLLSAPPSRTFIVAEESSRVLLVSYAAFRRLLCRSQSLMEVYVRGLECLLLEKAEREYELLSLDAGERYARLTGRHPQLEGRVRGRHLASYLGITPVHLSRLRRRRWRPIERKEPKR